MNPLYCIATDKVKGEGNVSTIKRDAMSLLDLTTNPLDICHLSTYLAVAKLDKSATLSPHIAVAINYETSDGSRTLLVTRRGEFIQTPTSLDSLIKKWIGQSSIVNWPSYQTTIEKILADHRFIKPNHRIKLHLSDETYFIELDTDFLLNINCIESYWSPVEHHLRSSQVKVITTDGLLLNLPHGKRSLQSRLDCAHTIILSTLSLVNGKIDHNNHFSLVTTLPTFMINYFRNRNLKALYITRERFLEEHSQ